MAEERDVPPLDELITEIDTIAANLDKTYPVGAEVSGADVMSELKNTFLPLLKDIAAASMLDIGDLQDEINPVKLTRADADETALLLKAYRDSNPTDAALQGRIDLQLEALEDDDGDGDDEEETETN